MLITRIAMSCWLVLVLALFGSNAYAVPDTSRLADLHRDAWTSKEGAPTEISAMAQTPDGWLWMSTSNGLYRFDGVRFERFQPPQGEALLESRLTFLYATPNGDLWLGYSGGGGVSVLRHGHLTHHSPVQPAIGSMYGVQHDPDGSLWLGSNKGLVRYAAGAWKQVGAEQGVPAGVANYLFMDQLQRMWVNINHKLFVRDRPGTPFVRLHPDRLNGGMATTPDGRLWVETETGMELIDKPHAGVAIPPSRIHGVANSAQCLFDRAGNFWTQDENSALHFISAGTLAGKTAFRHDMAPYETLATEPFKPKLVYSYLEDREGNIWVATSQGLERYRSQHIHTLRMEAQYGKVALANDGPDALWVVADLVGSLWRVTDDGPTRIPGNFQYHMVNSVFGGGALFAGTRGVEFRAPGQLEATSITQGMAPAAPLLEPRSGEFDGRNYWSSDAVRGPVKLVSGQWRTVAELGFPAGRSFVKTNGQGHVWIMYDDKVIDTQQTPARVYGKADGIDIGRLTILDPRQDVVVMGSTGMAVKVGKRFYRLRVDRPDLLADARAIKASANGDRWINTNSGLVRIAAADWQAWLAQPEGVLHTTLFDASDGYPGAQGNQGSVMATTDNGRRVWFAGKEGLAWIDSTTLVRNAIAPPVDVVRLQAGTLAYAGNDTPRLAAGTANISIDYAALSYIMPERIRFKYRLIGLDARWQDGATRRTVEYTNLGPGNYNFQVLAANEDGVWGTQPATMAFSIAPLFTQTWWFFSLCVMAVLGALAGLHRARVHNVRKNLAHRLHERLHERERIARSLHDTYLQSVQALIYVFHDVAQRLPAADGTQHGLDRALAMADDVLLQGREQVTGLRMSAKGIATLEQSLTEIGQALAENHRMACNIGTTGNVRILRGHVMEELFCIGREAMLNAFRHSRGTRVDILLCYDTRKFTLSIQDDGIGLPAAMLAQGNRAGHWGLPGMRERADNLHGAFAIGNLPGGGLRIVLAVPGRTAYAADRPDWRALARWWRSWRRPRH